ncbi:hypothetical protein GBA52_006362 [Prunus armeniaca]|nr:hypothetical protein GBA52_006362 [Prunus armeniaca]
MCAVQRIVGLVVAVMVAMVMRVVCSQSHDYGDALSKSILFFEGQRSGKLPSSQRMTWRKDSALRDGYEIGKNTEEEEHSDEKKQKDLSMGYYDAGDNVKFNFPMAFSTTMMAWSVLEFGKGMSSDLQHALDAIRWATDYFLKATSIPGFVFVQVGDPYGDHNCWERPEDMDTPRTPFAVFDFADKYQGSYNDSLGPWVCPFYCDFSGYEDELVWGAAWLFKATKQPIYWNYVLQNINQLESSATVKYINGVSYLGEALQNSDGIPSTQASTYFRLKEVTHWACRIWWDMVKNFLREFTTVGHLYRQLVNIQKQIDCKGGTDYYNSKNPNPNLLIGAVVGGPDIKDSYADSREDFVQSEPTTYINAPLVGVLAYFNSRSS